LNIFALKLVKVLLFSFGDRAEFRLSATSLSFNTQNLAKQKVGHPALSLSCVALWQARLRNSLRSNNA
jgi:hypothetical protein